MMVVNTLLKVFCPTGIISKSLLKFAKVGCVTKMELKPVMLSEVLLMEIRHIHTMGNRQMMVMSIKSPYMTPEEIAFFRYISTLLSYISPCLCLTMNWITEITIRIRISTTPMADAYPILNTLKPDSYMYWNREELDVPGPGRM